MSELIWLYIGICICVAMTAGAVVAVGWACYLIKAMYKGEL